MARINNTRSGAHLASLAENQKHEVHLMFQRLKRDKKRLAAENKSK